MKKYIMYKLCDLEINVDLSHCDGPITMFLKYFSYLQNWKFINVRVFLKYYLYLTPTQNIPGNEKTDVAAKESAIVNNYTLKIEFSSLNDAATIAQKGNT